MDDTAHLMSMIGEIFLTYRRALQRGLLLHGVSLKQQFLLRQLKDKPYLFPSDIADMLFCDRPTATVIIDNLVKVGWAKKERDPDNGKRVRISILAAGKVKQAELEKSGALRPPFDPFASLSIGERENLGKLLACGAEQVRKAERENQARHIR